MTKSRDESGIIIVILLFAVALMIFGYVIINSLSKSREAEQIKDSANGAAEVVNEAKTKAQDIIR